MLKTEIGAKTKNAKFEDWSESLQGISLFLVASRDVITVIMCLRMKLGEFNFDVR